MRIGGTCRSRCQPDIRGTNRAEAPSVPLISAKLAEQVATAAGGRLVGLVRRQRCGTTQKCPWDLVVTLGQEPKDRAAAAWIIADEIMRSRTDLDTDSYQIWRDATLGGAKLTGVNRARVHAHAYAVFDAAAVQSKGSHGLAGYVGEWLWYLNTRDLPPVPGYSVEILTSPGPTVTDSGGDGLIIHRVDGSSRGFVFRLWEMKKYSGEANNAQSTIRGAWKQLNTKGARYLAQMSWGDKYLTPDTRTFVSSLVVQWAEAAPSGSGGVSVALNASATPTKAFHLSHDHFTTHIHPGALQGLVVAIDDLEGFAREVRGYVWSAL
ncbi:hypothetical protein [Streptomyces sp. NPDC059757]|uniref:hypothetical protein n=1 Tax=Streptomyces sp. NPDC059757 TaxID=3346935 RepID=UPI003651AE5E